MPKLEKLCFTETIVMCHFLGFFRENTRLLSIKNDEEYIRLLLWKFI